MRCVSYFWTLVTIVCIASILSSSETPRFLSDAESSRIYGSQGGWSYFNWSQCSTLGYCATFHCSEGYESCEGEEERERQESTNDMSCRGDNSDNWLSACAHTSGSETCAMVYGLCYLDTNEENELVCLVDDCESCIGGNHAPFFCIDDAP